MIMSPVINPPTPPTYPLYSANNNITQKANCLYLIDCELSDLLQFEDLAVLVLVWEGHVSDLTVVAKSLFAQQWPDATENPDVALRWRTKGTG